MVHVKSFQKLFGIDLRSLEGSARWWFLMAGWITRPRMSRCCSIRTPGSSLGPLVEAVEAFWGPTRGVIDPSPVPTALGRSQAG
jgi:hypothetical protein